MSIHTKSVLSAFGQVAAIMGIMYFLLLVLSKNIEPDVIIQKETEYIYKTDSLDRVNAILSYRVYSLRFSLISIRRKYEIQQTVIRSKTVPESVAYFLSKTHTGTPSLDSVTVPVSSIRSANELINELEYKRSKAVILQVQSNYQLQQITTTQAKETACVELVQVYRDQPKRKPKVRWWQLALGGVVVGVLVK